MILEQELDIEKIVPELSISNETNDREQVYTNSAVSLIREMGYMFRDYITNQAGRIALEQQNLQNPEEVIVTEEHVKQAYQRFIQNRPHQ